MIAEVDKSITLFLNSFTGDSFLFDFLFFLFATVFPVIVAFSLLFLLLRNWKKNKLFVGEALTAGLSAKYLIVNSLRYFFPRERPFEVLDEINLILPLKDSASLPSGHAAFLFAVSVVVFYHHKRVGIALLSLSLVSVLSRVLAGVHFFLDIISGLLVGVIAGVVVSEIFIYIKKKKGLK